MSVADRPLAVLTEESEHRLESMRRGIKRAAGFVLYVLVAKDLGRVELLRRLRAWSGVGGFPELYFFPEGEEGARAVERFLAVKDEEHAPAGVVVPDGAALIDADGGSVLATLNVSRDILDKVVRGPLLLVVPPEREGDLAGRAADLFDVRAGTVAVEGERLDMGPLLLATVAPDLTAPPRPLAELRVEAARLRALGENEDPPLGALADAWVRLGETLFNHREMGEARDCAALAQELAHKTGYATGVTAGTLLEGRVLQEAGRFDEAEARFQKALAIGASIGDRLRTASAHWHIGAIARERGNLEEAAQAYLQALALNKDVNDPLLVALTQAALGHVALLRGDLSNARAWIEDSIEVFERLGQQAALANVYSQLGLIARLSGEVEQAHSLYERSRALKERLGDEDGAAFDCALLGELAEQRGHPDEALAWNIRAVSRSSKRMLLPPLVHIIAHLGLPALESAWQRITGHPLPADVRAYVEAHLHDAQPPAA